MKTMAKTPSFFCHVFFSLFPFLLCVHYIVSLIAYTHTHTHPLFFFLYWIPNMAFRRTKATLKIFPLGFDRLSDNTCV